MTDPDAKVTIPLHVLEPFISFADHAVDEHGWSGSTQRERIVDWFGPSDFRRLKDTVGSAWLPDE